MAGFGLGTGSSDSGSGGENRGVPARPLPKPINQEEIRDGVTLPMGEVMPDYKRGDDGYTSWGSEWGESHENVVPDEDEEENLFTHRKKKERNSDGEPAESGIKKVWAKIVRNYLGKLLALGALLAAVAILVLVVVLGNQNHESATPTPETKTSTSSPADTRNPAETATTTGKK